LACNATIFRRIIRRFGCGRFFISRGFVRRGARFTNCVVSGFGAFSASLELCSWVSERCMASAKHSPAQNDLRVDWNKLLKRREEDGQRKREIADID
jgi:hypothetical protein